MYTVFSVNMQNCKSNIFIATDFITLQKKRKKRKPKKSVKVFSISWMLEYTIHPWAYNFYSTNKSLLGHVNVRRVIQT